MRQDLQRRKYPLYIGITTLVVIIVVVLTSLFFWISHKESSKTALKMADRLFSEVNEKVVERYQNALGRVAVFADSAVLMPSMAEVPVLEGLSHPSLEFMLKMIERHTYMFSHYAGYSDGSFLQVIATRKNPAILLEYNAPEGTDFIVRSISIESEGSIDSEGTRKQYWSFLDRDRQIIASRIDPDPAYDPRNRPWYRKALESDAAIFTDPYVFSSSKVPGITCAKKFSGKGGVFGADITLEKFSQSLKKEKVSKNSTLFFFDLKGRLMAHSEEDPVKTIITEKDGETTEEAGFLRVDKASDPVTKRIIASYKTKEGFSFGKTWLMDIGGEKHLVHLSRLSEELGFDQIIGSTAPLTDFTGHIRQMQYRISILSLVVLIVVLPIIFFMAKRLSRSMMLLEKEADKIKQFDFSESEPFDSAIKEVHSLIQAVGLTKLTIRQRTEALIATQKKLEKLVKSGIALSAEQDVNRFLEMIFNAAKELSYADGGALYLRDEEDKLCFAIMQTASRGTIRAEELDDADAFKPIPLYNRETGDENHRNVESHVALSGKTERIDEIAQQDRFAFSDACTFDETTGDQYTSFLTVPLKPRQGKSIGVLQLFKARDAKSGELIPFEEEIVWFVEALAAQAAVALQNKKLLEEQRELFNAFIQLIAGAVDAKSPYTGAHCARVPEIAMLLAKAVNDSTKKPFADFTLSTEDEWREFRVAAWLHDCGKITTPEFVVDKATKLETIYNRIHEIRTRFEALWRDAEIEYYRKLLNGNHDEKKLKAELQSRRDKISDDFAFVAECNVGGEFMADEKIDRLKKIAAQKWLRHLDDRLGLSKDEAALKEDGTEQKLHVEEFLLADKPEHIIPRSGKDPFEGNPYGFKMEVPENLFDGGELHNLCIRKGTLSAEERFKINEHITQTIIMLGKLPLPSYMANILEIAGAHHETMDGKGYPRKLTRNEMSIPARIMAIADIFEALTASDRPYKKAKTLSESLRIMSFMRNDRHIDEELFDLFLQSGVYKEYAAKYLDPKQIDEVDINGYLSTLKER